MSWLALAIVGVIVIGVLLGIAILCIVAVTEVEGIDILELTPVGYDGVSVMVRVTVKIDDLRKLRNSKEVKFTVDYKHFGTRVVAQQAVSEGYRIEIGHIEGDTFKARLVKYE